MTAAERVALAKAVAWPGPADLADYLVGKRKAKEQFANGNGGRCCLGHYADMCGLSFLKSQTDFSTDDDEGSVSLPDGHWLLAKSPTSLMEVVPGDRANTPFVDTALAYINDHNVGFDKVIEALRKLAAKP